jgi:outer membrane protein assembly factor BamB
MSDVRHILEERRRAHQPEPGGFDRLVQRRTRRQRNQRIAAAGVALTLMAGAAYGAVIALREVRQGLRPAGPSISASNVSRLRLSWTGSMGGGVTPSAPVDGGDRIFVGADRLYAFPASCGDAACKPLWTWRPPEGRRVVSRPAVAGDLVFVSAGSLYALPVDCGTRSSACEPVWVAPQPPGDTAGYSAPIVAGGVVYVNSAMGPYGFPANCGTGGAVCSPVWHGSSAGGFSGVDVSEGKVFVNGPEGLFVYPVACPGDALACRPLWFAPHGGAFSSPVAGAGMVFVHHGASTLYAFPEDCRSDGGSCDPAWSWRGPFTANPSDMQVSDGLGYVAGPDGNLYAFAVDCGSRGSTCDPLWSAALPRSVTLGAQLPPPVVAVDLVFVYADRLSAFPARCSEGDSCSPLWTSDVLATRSHLTSPLVTPRAVFVTSPSGLLSAFTVATD